MFLVRGIIRAVSTPHKKQTKDHQDFVTHQILWGVDKRTQDLIQLATQRGNGDPVPELLDTLHGQQDVMRVAAARALGVIVENNPNVPQRNDIIDGLIDALHDGLIPTDVVVIAGRTYFRDQRAPLRGATAEALARIADPRSIDGLIMALQLRHVGARRQAAVGLGKIGDPKAVPALINLLDDPDPDVRDTAIASLKRIGTPEALNGIEAWQEERRRRANQGF